MTLTGFESTFPGIERPHTFALERGQWQSIGFEPIIYGFKFCFYNILKIFEIIIGKY